MIEIFEHSKSCYSYYIDENTFEVFMKKSNGTLKKIKRKKSKFGTVVNLYVFYDDCLKRCRNRKYLEENS